MTKLVTPPDPRQPLRLGFLDGPRVVSGCAPPAFERITTERDAPAEPPARGPPRRHRRGPAIRNLAETWGTDAVLSTMMSCTCSVYSWDNVVRRVGSKLLLDQKYSSDFDLLTVSGMAKPPRGEGKSFNAPATCSNHSVSQQRLGMGKERYNFPSPNPQWRPTRIRIKSPGDDVDLIARGAHGWIVTRAHGGGSSINIQTLSEWDSRRSNGTAWHQKLESQPRASLPPAELKNNSYKLSRRTCWALLARSEDRKLGYLSWNREKDISHHVILGTQQCPPHECARPEPPEQRGRLGHAHCLLHFYMKMEEGQYLILQDPNKWAIPGCGTMRMR